MNESCLGLIRNLSKTCLRLVWHFVWDLPEACPRLARDLSETCPRLVWDLPETCPRLAWDFAWGLPETCPRLAWDLSKTCPRLAPWWTNRGKQIVLCHQITTPTLDCVPYVLSQVNFHHITCVTIATCILTCYLGVPNIASLSPVYIGIHMSPPLPTCLSESISLCPCTNIPVYLYLYYI